jgi:LYAR-type C2HC zinc finger
MYIYCYSFDRIFTFMANHLATSISDDYRAHTSCVTEVERYEKKGSLGSHNNKKSNKLTPQQAWMDLIQSSIDSAPQQLKSYLETITTLDNVPRKEKQFRNFASNSLQLANRRGGQQSSEQIIVTEIWKHLNTFREQRKEKQQSEQQQVEADKSAKKMSSKKKDTDADENDSVADDVESAGDVEAQQQQSQDNIVTAKTTLDANTNIKNTVPGTGGDDTKRKTIVRKAMKSVLKKSNNRSLSTKELRKAMVQYFSQDQNNITSIQFEKDELKSLIRRTIDCEKRFLVEGKIVTLRVSK